MRAKQPVSSIDGAIQPVRKGCASRCKVAAVASVFSAVTLGAAPEARAQDALAAIFIGGFALDAGAAVGGLITGVGSAFPVERGEIRPGWFISSYVFGGLNVASTILWASIAEGNPSSADAWGMIAGVHGTIAALNLVMPTIGFVRGKQSSPYDAQLRPIVVGGLDAAGQRWTGAGLQLTGF